VVLPFASRPGGLVAAEKRGGQPGIRTLLKEVAYLLGVMLGVKLTLGILLGLW
jgi:hypothetical protein